MTRDYLKLCGTDHRVDETVAIGQAATYRLIAEYTDDVLLRYDAAGCRVYVSPSVEKMLGFLPEDLLGKHSVDLVHPEDVPRAQATLRNIGPDRPSLRNSFRVRCKDGTYLWAEGRYRYLAADGGVLAVVRDISARKRVERMLAESNRQLEATNQILKGLAQQDGLTGLANRRRFDELLALEYARARREALPLGLVLLDVDCFKAYNDCYGHLAGDDCLRRVSRAIAQVLRRPGDHAARYGGEELVALLPATDHDGAVMMAESMRAAVEALSIEHRGNQCGIVTISAGASALPPAGSVASPAAIVEQADRALYEAKTGGRNQVRGSLTMAMS